MAISRDNAEIVAKEIQISLNLFERAEHVLKDAVLPFNLCQILLNSQIAKIHLSRQPIVFLAYTPV